MTDTRTSTLPAEPPPPGPRSIHVETAAEAAARAGLVLPSRRHRWWTLPLAGLVTVFLLLVAVTAVLPADLVAEKENARLGVVQAAPYARTPASAQPVGDRIRFGELEEVADQFPADGDFYFVTVTEPSQSVLSWFLGRDEPAIELLTEEDKFGFRTPEQRRAIALESMRTSEQTAQFVALQRVGFDVELVPGEVLIEAMLCLERTADGRECQTWSPSDEVLDPGDRILEVAGERIDGVEDLSRILTGYEPGDVVAMRIERPDVGELDVEVELTSAPDDPERTLVGFLPFDTRRVELPFELDIDTGSIGGPSAGLAFTLTLIDELTPGELTGRRDVAVTGTIELDSSVGPIGGLRQKASAVAQAGVDVFLVPGLPEGASEEQVAAFEGELAAAQLAGGDGLRIIPVLTLEEALDALVALGGDPIPPPGECAVALDAC